MKLNVDELEDIIACIEVAQELEFYKKTDLLKKKLELKLSEIKGKTSRLLSNSELKNIGF